MWDEGTWAHRGSGKVAEGGEPGECATPASERLELVERVVVLNLGGGWVAKWFKEG